jgi:hypothetical protein
MENLKLKNLLKKLFENKEFEMSLIDEESLWDEDERGWTDVEITYNFKFHVVVLNVIGEGSYAVGEIDVIIDDITKDGRDFYSDWVDRNYSSGTWYIEELKDKFYYEYFENIPFNIQSGFYGHDEKRYNEYLTQESVIKRIVREDQHNSVKINMGNDKLKNLLKKLFENKEFETTITDSEDVYNGLNNITQDVIYNFKFHVVVRSVIGNGSDAVGDIDIIIDSITKNGKDHYRIWAGNGYNNAVWYIRDLDQKFYLDYLDDLPFSVYSTVYGHDENITKKDTIDESVIKKIVKETVMDKFIDSVIPQLNNLKRKSNYSSRMYGSNTIYYDKSDRKYYFRVSDPREVATFNWLGDNMISYKKLPRMLYIDKEVYNEISEFIPNNEMILKWFNEKYKQDAGELSVQYTLKDR